MSLSPRRLALAIPLFFTLLYLALPTRQYYWDGIAFAITIEKARGWGGLFNPHHLLYNHIGYLEYRLSRAAIRVLYLLQRTNCLAGGVFLWLLYRLLRSLGVPAENGAAWIAVAGASATFWKFTTDVDSYILANLFLLLAFLSLPRSPLRGGLFHWCALLLHQLSALFYPVGLVLLWGRKRFARDASIYTVVTGGGTLASYALAYRLAPRELTAPTLAGWLTFHAQIPFSFRLLENGRWLLLGTARLLAGGKLSSTAYLAAPVAAVLCACAVIPILRKRPRFLPPPDSAPLLLWLGMVLAFLFVWEPYNTFYRLFYLAPLIALGSLVTRNLPARSLALFAAALFTWNFLQFIYPNTRIENNAPLAVALDRHKQWPPGTGIVFAEFVPDLWTIAYFNPQVSWIGLERPDPARVAALAATYAHTGGHLYLDWTYLQKSGESPPRFAFRAVTPRQTE
jgi:hypothetical protein